MCDLEQRCKELSISVSDLRMIVSIKRQQLFLLKADSIENIYPISTSKNPPSCQENSFGTPLGLHSIAEKIGAGVAKGTVFKARIPQSYTYEHAPIDDRQKNLITTRIIRIRGLDPDLNAGVSQDSYDRYIYLHGTNHEDQIGQPFSQGCIELSNTAIIELFQTVSKGDTLWIG